ncbi:MAG: DHH family phosphoesterase [Ignisphaera sp.]
MQEKIRMAILRSENIAILTHSNADPDALASACVLAYLISRMNSTSNIRVVVSDGIGSECKDMVKLCIGKGVKIETIKRATQLKIDKEDLCLLVDVASTEQLRYAKPILTACKTVVILDHHDVHDYNKNLLDGKDVIYILDPDASSTAEMVYKLINELNIAIEVDFLRILLAGIIWDTKRFLRVAPNTFKYVNEMMEKGVQYVEALKMIEGTKPTYSRIARIRCLLRHRGFKAIINNREVYIAVSEVGAYESDCATALITMGYDIAFILNTDESLKTLRLIYRVRENLMEELQIDIYRDVLKKLVDAFGGGGGGHKGAGGVVLRTISMEAVVSEIIKILNAISNNNLTEFVEEKVG